MAFKSMHLGTMGRVGGLDGGGKGDNACEIQWNDARSENQMQRNAGLVAELTAETWAAREGAGLMPHTPLSGLALVPAT